MRTATTSPATGTCIECGERVTIVNHRTISGPDGKPVREEGYLGRHYRPGTRAGTSCRGSFGAWAERRAARFDANPQPPTRW